MGTTIKILLVAALAALAACGPKTVKPAADDDVVAKADGARWHCVTFEDAPSDCVEDPCPESDAYVCVPSDVAWCFEPPLRDRECAITSEECEERSRRQLEIMQEEDGGDVPAECFEMK